MAKRVFVLEAEDMEQMIREYVCKQIGVNPYADSGRYSFAFISTVNDGRFSFDSIKVERSE